MTTRCQQQEDLDLDNYVPFICMGKGRGVEMVLGLMSGGRIGPMSDVWWEGEEGREGRGIKYSTV